MDSILRASCVGFALCIYGWAESSPATNTQLAVQVLSEAALAWQEDAAVLVKVRLAPGTQVRVWADGSCGTQPASVHVIPASGTYAIPLAEIDGSPLANVCLSSSDGGLRTFLAALRK